MKKNLLFLYAAFAFSIFVLVIISIVTSRQVSYLLKYTDQIDITDKVINLLSEVEMQLYKAESNQRGYLITRDTAYLKEFSATHKTIFPVVDSLKKVVPDARHRNDLIIINNSIATRLMLLQQTIDNFLSGNQEAFKNNVAEGNVVMEDFKARTLKFQNEQIELLKESEVNKKRYEVAAPAYLRLIFFLTILFQLSSFIVIVREFRKKYAYQKDLERKIQELNMSHNELEQIAFIASHDLQEPLRKMRTFGGKLILQHKDVLNESGQAMIAKIDSAARRMQGLIEDLVDYTTLINSTEEKQEVNLNTCIEEVQINLANLIRSQKVEITIAPLPIINGYQYQLHLLFTNLVHNAIKFSKPGENPVIDISFFIIEGNNKEELPEKSNNEKYIRISFKDYGIGFENEFAKKIFVMFQRLHNQNSTYEGKGIGLSICKRVMTNHNGFIKAEGEPGEGATFHLYFPA